MSDEYQTWVNEADKYLTECGVPEHGEGGELFSLRHRILLYGQEKEKRIAEQAATIDQLRQELAEVTAKAIDQSEYIQSHGLTEYEMARLTNERDQAQADARELAQALHYALLLVEEPGIITNAAKNVLEKHGVKYLAEPPA